MISTVTGLRERKRGCVAVELDGRPWRVLPVDAVAHAGLEVGHRLDRETARELARALRRARAVADAARSLAASDRSRQALEHRLRRAGHPASAREDAIATLDRAGLLDDARLARDRAELLARRGYGNAAIRSDLRRRLIPDEAAAQAVDSLEPELHRAWRLLDAQKPTPVLLRRLAGRGFSPETLGDVAATFALEE